MEVEVQALYSIHSRLVLVDKLNTKSARSLVAVPNAEVENAYDIQKVICYYIFSLHASSSFAYTRLLVEESNTRLFLQICFSTNLLCNYD